MNDTKLKTLKEIETWVAGIAARFPTDHPAVQELNSPEMSNLKTDAGRRLALLNWLMNWSVVEPKAVQR